MSFNEWEQAHKEFKKKKRTFAWSIMYLNEWKQFRRQFLLSLQRFFPFVVFLFCLQFCLLSHFELDALWNYWWLHQYIFWWNTTEKRKLEKCFLAATFLAPKPVYRLRHCLISKFPHFSYHLAWKSKYFPRFFFNLISWTQQSCKLANAIPKKDVMKIFIFKTKFWILNRNTEQTTTRNYNNK